MREDMRDCRCRADRSASRFVALGVRCRAAAPVAPRRRPRGLKPPLDAAVLPALWAPLDAVGPPLAVPLAPLLLPADVSAMATT